MGNHFHRGTCTSAGPSDHTQRQGGPSCWDDRRRPGETELLIGATPDADLRLVLKRDGHTLTKRLSLGANSSGKLIVPWSCAAPGGVYSYTITATDTYGASLDAHREVPASEHRALPCAEDG